MGKKCLVFKYIFEKLKGTQPPSFGLLTSVLWYARFNFTEQNSHIQKSNSNRLPSLLKTDVPGTQKVFSKCWWDGLWECNCVAI